MNGNEKLVSDYKDSELLSVDDIPEGALIYEYGDDGELVPVTKEELLSRESDS